MAKVKVELPIFNQGNPLVQGPYCDKCHYQHTGGRRIEPDGSGSNGICIVGDSPWKEEILANRNFSGASGRWLDTILSKRGLTREEFTVTNSYWCSPPALGMNDEPWKYPEAEYAQKQCKPYLDNLVAKRVPKVFIALGNVALRRLTGFEGIEGNHAYVIPSVYEGIPAVPTFHPSSIIQGNWKYTIAFILSLARAVEIANGSYKPTETKIIEDPPPAYINFPGRGDIPFLMCDIETPRSLQGKNEEESEDDPSYQILRMGFSIRQWEGVSFPFDGDYIRRAKELIRKARVISFWNKNYDLPRLKSNGFELHPDVQIVDAMWAWHWLYSDLPKALNFAAPFFYSGKPWKHLHSQRPAFYNGMDNAVQMGVYEGTKAQLIKDGRWDRFWSHCVKVDPIYVNMGVAGVKVDKEARVPFMAAMETDAKVEFNKVQELLPAKLIKIEQSFKPLKKSIAGPNTPISKRIYIEATKTVSGEAPAKTKDGSLVIAGGQVMRPIWIRTKPFNPNSRPDLLDLMRELKVKIPKARGDDRESTEAKYLKRLTKHPIFRHCVSYKQKLKFLSTYNWPLDENDRAHSQYGFHPSTWRSSSRNVNLGNIPKRNDLARLFRRTIIAEEGCKLIEIDRSGLEAVLVGYWAKSPEYIKLAKAGVHSYLGSIVLGDEVPWAVIRDTPLPELKKLLKQFKKRGGDDYEGWKRCVHGSSYLLSPYGMHDEYEEYFPTEYSAQKVQDILFGSPAGQAIRSYHKATLEEVWGKKYLDNSFQYRHYFYGPIYKMNKRANKWEVDHEGDAKRAIAFRPQSDGAAIQREDILALSVIPNIGNLMRLPTYDSLVFETPNHLVDSAIECMARQFNKPIAELGGLDIGFEIKVGSNLAPMDDDNKNGMNEVNI